LHGTASCPSIAIIATDIPARPDAQPFGGFHLSAIVARGIS